MNKRTIPVDVHKETAAKIFGVLIKDVTPEQREIGKNKNYVDWFTISKAERAVIK